MDTRKRATSSSITQRGFHSEAEVVFGVKEQQPSPYCSNDWIGSSRNCHGVGVQVATDTAITIDNFLIRKYPTNPDSQATMKALIEYNFKPCCIQYKNREREERKPTSMYIHCSSVAFNIRQKYTTYLLAVSIGNFYDARFLSDSRRRIWPHIVQPCWSTQGHLQSASFNTAPPSPIPSLVCCCSRYLTATI